MNPPSASSQEARPGDTGELVWRLALTLALVLLAYGSRHFRWPGSEQLPSLIGGEGPVIYVGLGPFILAYGVVELLSLISRRGRQARVSGAAARRPLLGAALALGLVMAASHGFGTMSWFETLQAPTTERPFQQLLGTGLYVLGSLVHLGVAFAITRWGIGNGFSVLIGFDLLRGLTWSSGPVKPPPLPLHRILAATDPPTPFEYLAGYGAPLAVFVALVGVQLLLVSPGRTASKGSALGRSAILLPTVGLVPLAWVTVPEEWILTARFWLGPEGRLPFSSDGKLIAGSLVVLVGTVLLSHLLANPGRVQALLVQTHPTLVPGHATLKQIWGNRTTLTLIALFSLFLADWLLSSNGVAIDVWSLGILSAIAVDLLREWQWRSADPTLTPVWSLHRPYAVGPVLDLLAAQGIAAQVRGLYHRVALQIFGPFVPMEIWVPGQHAERARKLLEDRLGSGPGAAEAPTSARKRDNTPHMPSPPAPEGAIRDIWLD